MKYANEIVNHLIHLLPTIENWEISNDNAMFAIAQTEGPPLGFSSILENKKLQKKYQTNLKIPIALRGCVGSYVWRVVPTRYNPRAQNRYVEISLNALANGKEENRSYITLVFG